MDIYTYPYIILGRKEREKDPGNLSPKNVEERNVCKIMTS